MKQKSSSIILLGSLCVSLALSAASNYSGSQSENDSNLKVNVTQGNQKTPYDNSEDFRILNDVQEAIKSYSRGNNINVRIMDGVITVNGTVRSPFDKQNIENSILQVRGVQKVDNQLQVDNKLTSSRQNY